MSLLSCYHVDKCVVMGKKIHLFTLIYFINYYRNYCDNKKIGMMQISKQAPAGKSKLWDIESTLQILGPNYGTTFRFRFTERPNNVQINHQNNC